MALLTLIIVGPIAMWAQYQLFPPEEIVVPRKAVPARAQPGTEIQSVGTYKILRKCHANFVSIQQWETRDGLQYKETGKHFGSVRLVPNGEIVISRRHRIPDNALPGTQFRYRTKGHWYCLPRWMGWDLGTRIEYAEIVVEVGY